MHSQLITNAVEDSIWGVVGFSLRPTDCNSCLKTLSLPTAEDETAAAAEQLILAMMDHWRKGGGGGGFSRVPAVKKNTSSIA